MPRFCPDFTSICPVHAPYCPGFASQNPRFASYVMERRGWDGRFPSRFGMGFACRGEGGGFNAAQRAPFVTWGGCPPPKGSKDNRDTGG